MRWSLLPTLALGQHLDMQQLYMVCLVSVACLSLASPLQASGRLSWR